MCGKLMFLGAKKIIAVSLFAFYAVSISNGNGGGAGAKPMCYTDVESRKEILDGEWKLVDREPNGYNNLSCSIEFTKYSCVHQGSLGRAQYAAQLEFVPSSCSLKPARDEIDAAKMYAGGVRNRSVYFIGDSLMKQVAISLVCSLESSGQVQELEVDWACSPGLPEAWRCSTPNCVACGPHSGFHHMRARLRPQQSRDDGPDGDVSLQYWYREGNDRVSQDAIEHLKRVIGPDDILFVQAGVHGTREKATERMLGLVTDILNLPNLQMQRPKIIWIATYDQNFPTKTGEYNQAQMNGSHRCSPHSTLHRASFEKYMMASKASQIFDGFIFLKGMNKLGGAKVGSVNHGRFFDCTHFCLPGPPDKLADAVHTYLVSTGSRE